MTVVRPLKGPQEAFLSCGATFVVYGGAAGGAKTFGILLDGARGVSDPNFRGVIFRRVMPNITNAGGLLDESKKLYPLLGGVLVTSPRIEWRFPSGATIQFSHLQHVQDVESHKGAQYTWIAFDEITEFEQFQVWYMFSRLRSPESEWDPWMRASTNPDAASWVRQLLDWWIDPVTGYAIPERSGVIRYFTKEGDKIVWRDEPHPLYTSFTFIASSLEDNTELLKKDPGYRNRLKLLGHVENEKLEKGNWNVTAKEGIFKHHRIDRDGIHPAQLPEGLIWLRYWDLADTEPHEKNPDPDWTAGPKVALYTDEHGTDSLYIRDMAHARLHGSRKRAWMRGYATRDGLDVEQWIEQEGGATGSEAAHDYQTTHLAGFRVRMDRPTGSKSVRAGRWLPLAEQGRVYLVREESGRRPDWFDTFLSELESFPHGKRDQVDGVSGGYAACKDKQGWWVS